MVETEGSSKKYEIKQLDTHIRKKRLLPNIEHYKELLNIKKDVYDYDSLEWLATNYEREYGLRNWTWQVIIDGIIDEHRLENFRFEKGMESSITKLEDKEFDMHHIEPLWYAFLDAGDIQLD